MSAAILPSSGTVFFTTASGILVGTGLKAGFENVGQIRVTLEEPTVATRRPASRRIVFDPLVGQPEDTTRAGLHDSKFIADLTVSCYSSSTPGCAARADSNAGDFVPA